METAAEQMEVDVKLAKDAVVKDLLEKRVNEWRERAARYESEPKPNGKGEGRKELMARALQAESHRDLASAKYHNFELGSAAFQIAIVLASSYLITGVIYLLWGAAGVGALGILFTVYRRVGAACAVVLRRALIAFPAPCLDVAVSLTASVQAKRERRGGRKWQKDRCAKGRCAGRRWRAR